jgi:hypothetical protein
LPLNWPDVKTRYAPGTKVKPAVGTRELTVVAVDDENISLASSLWTKTLKREHLERAVDLMERGEMSTRLANFVEEYGKQVTTARRSLAAQLLNDMGYLE